MTKEEKLIEFIKRTSEDLCLICKYPDDMRQCKDDMPPVPCAECQRECHCKTCDNGSSFVLDEEKLDEWVEGQK